METPILDIAGLTTRFYTYEGVVKALENLSLSLPRDRFFGLVGESGCGKSVTVRSILRIVQSPGIIQGGQIRFSPRTGKAVDLLSLGEAEMEGIRGNAISMVFQEPNAALNPIMTVGEQIAESYLFHRSPSIIQSLLYPEPYSPFPPKPVSPLARPLLRGVLKTPALGPILSRLPLLKQWDRAVRTSALEKSRDLLEKLGIPDPGQIIHRYPHQLSGGMKQRVVIAMALAGEPELLIADEATSNLDITVQAQILELLKNLKQRKIISSVLLITHDLGVVAQTCDQVGVMYAGSLCETGTTTQVFQNPAHPYTRALIQAVPRMESQQDLAPIPGHVPNLVDPPTGCRFHPRCPQAMEICKCQPPPLAPLPSESNPTGETDAGLAPHCVACFLHGGRP